MKLIILKEALSVYQVTSLKEIDTTAQPLFIGQTADELSVVSPTEVVPADTIKREDHWQAFKIVGPLDFSLVGILAKIATLLAEVGVSIFAVSTYDTDYVLVKSDKLETAITALQKNGYEVER
jgi:hypothetical protein